MKNNKKELFTKDSYFVSFEKAAWFIYSFLRQPALAEIATTQALGGTFPREIFEKKREDAIAKGIAAWFCTKEGRLFLAIEKDGEYDIGNVPQAPPDEAQLYYPENLFTYRGDVNEASVIETLRNHVEPLQGTINVSGEEIKPWLQALPSDPAGRPYNKYHCCFFENYTNTDVEAFLRHSSQVAAVRYYFGYDDSNSYYFDSNRIRVILIGVDQNGRNIAPTFLRGESEYMLENSWPPPPPNTKNKRGTK